MKVYYTEKDADLKHAMFAKIREDLAKIPGPFERVVLVVPRQSTFSIEEEALDTLGGKGFFTLNVVSADKLRGDIIRQTGGSGRTSVNAIGRGMVLRRAAAKLGPQLSAFSGVCTDPRFTELLRDLTVQLKQGGIDSARLSELADGLVPGSLLERKLRDVSLIEAAYEDALAGTFSDSEDELAFVTSRVSESGYIKTSKVYYYGFSTFSVLEKDFLKALDRSCAGLDIYLSCGEGMEFAVTKKTIAMLGAPAERLPETGGAKGAQPSLEVVLCASPFTQAEALAARILRLVREEGMSYSDIAVLTPGSDAAGSLLKRVLVSAGIPVFMDERRSVLHSSCAEAAAALLSLTDGCYNEWDIIRFLKSGVYECDKETVWAYGSYSKRFRVRGRRFLTPLRYRDDCVSDEQFSAFEKLRADLAALLVPFVEAFAAEPKAEGKARVFARFLSEELGIEKRLETLASAFAEAGFTDAAEETRQLWPVTDGILRQITELLGDEEMSCEEFGRIVMGALKDIKVGVLPQAEGRVQIGEIRRSLPAAKKAVFITGFCDGLIPSAAEAGGILTETELNALSEKGAVLAKSSAALISEEIFMVFRAAGCAEKLLWTGITAGSESGEALNASPLLKELEKRYENVLHISDAENSGDVLQFIQGENMPVGKTAEALRAGLAGDPVPEVWKAVYNILKDKAPQLKAGLLCTGKEEPLGKGLAKDLYGRGGELSLSPSRLDSFAACPFKHFVSYGLKPMQPKDFGIASAEIGDIYHEALLKLCEKLSEDARKAGKAMTDPSSLWMTVSRQQAESMVSDIIDGMADDALGGVMSSSKAEVYRSQRVKEVCMRFAWHMIEQVRAGSIDSMFFEISFGRGGKLPPLELETAAGRVYIEGKIDRVDELPGPGGSRYTKIVDYKSGSTSFSRPLIEKGLMLQLMIYLEGAMGGRDSKPAGIYYFRIGADEVEAALADMDSDSLSDEILEKISSRYRLDGLTVNDEAVLRGLDGGLVADGRSGVVNVKRNKDGAFTGAVISAEEMDDLRKQFKAGLKSAAESLAMGDISAVRKTVGTVFDSCRYCSYSGICLRDMYL